MPFIKNLRKSLRVSPEKEQKIVAEIEQHLEEEAHTLQLQGKNSVLARQESEQDFGNAQEIAQALNETHQQLPQLLRTLHLRHAILLIALYGFICSYTSLTYAFFTPGSSPAWFIVTIPQIALFFISAKMLHAQKLSRSELRKAYTKLFVHFSLFHALFLGVIALFDNKIKDILTGGIMLRYEWYLARMPSDFGDAFALFLITTTLYLFALLAAIGYTSISKNQDGFLIRM